MNNETDLYYVVNTREYIASHAVDISWIPERERVLKEILTPAILKNVILLALEKGYIHQGQIVWDMLPAELPLQPNAIEGWEIKQIALSHFRQGKITGRAFENTAWWWRLRLLYDIPDPCQWLVETYSGTKGKRGSKSKKALEIWKKVYGTPPPENYLVRVYLLVRTCKKYIAQ